MDSELSSTRRPRICSPPSPLPADAATIPADAHASNRTEAVAIALRKHLLKI